MTRIPCFLRRATFLLTASATLGLATPAALGQAEAASPPARTPDLKPMTDGPLHEAFLSPRRDVDPPVVAQSPPPPVAERPGPEPPRTDARWIEGYWEWSPEHGKFVWVTGTWRVPPPGRFWVNTFWKRNEKGWRRIPGFWSDRATDRIVYGQEGPPKDRPIDDSGAPPKSNCFYIPGQYVVDGDRIAWRKGFWADAKPGWSWTPATWTRQPEGWIFQEGYWDRPLEERGVLYAPAEIARDVRPGEVLSYRPYTEISPELFGQLYGAFGRPSPYYDGYPGVAYDQEGRYFAYAGYGNLAPYYGYLDFPSVGGFGYPYYVAPIDYTYRQIFPAWGGSASPLVYGFGLPYYGFGNSILPLTMGYPMFGNLALAGAGWGWGWPGWGIGGAGWGNVGWSGVALGTWPGFNWGTFGWSGPAIGAFPTFAWNLGFPNWLTGWGVPGFGLGIPGFGSFGFGGLGLGGFGLGGFGLGGFGSGGFGLGGPGWGFGSPGLIWGGNSPLWANRYPFQNSGRHEIQPLARAADGHQSPPPTRPQGTSAENLADHGAMRRGPLDLPSRGLGGLRNATVEPPPATRPFASLAHNASGSTSPASRHDASFAGAMRTAADGAPRASTWMHSYNGVAPMASQRHEVARPAFANNPHNAAAGGFRPQLHGGGAPGVQPGGVANVAPGVGQPPAWRGGMRDFPSPPGGMNAGFAPQLHSPSASLSNLGGGGGLLPANAPGGIAGSGGGMRGSDSSRGAGLGSGFTGGMRQPGGFTNAPSFGAGVYNNGGMGAAFSGGMRTGDGPGAMRGGSMAGPNLGGSSFSGFGGARGGGLGTGFGAGGANMGGIGGSMGGSGMGMGVGGGHMR